MYFFPLNGSTQALSFLPHWICVSRSHLFRYGLCLLVSAAGIGSRWSRIWGLFEQHDSQFLGGLGLKLWFFFRQSLHCTSLAWRSLFSLQWLSPAGVVNKIPEVHTLHWLLSSVSLGANCLRWDCLCLSHTRASTCMCMCVSTHTDTHTPLYLLAIFFLLMIWNEVWLTDIFIIQPQRPFYGCLSCCCSIHAVFPKCWIILLFPEHMIYFLISRSSIIKWEK